MNQSPIEYLTSSIDYTAFNLPVVQIYDSKDVLYFDSATLDQQPISIGTDMVSFTYKFTDEKDEDDECNISFETNNIQFLNHPLFRLEKSIKVSWGYIVGGKRLIRKPLLIMIRDIEREYTARGIKLTLICTDNFAALKKQRSPELQRAEQVYNRVNKASSGLFDGKVGDLTFSLHSKDGSITTYNARTGDIMMKYNGREITEDQKEFIQDFKDGKLGEIDMKDGLDLKQRVWYKLIPGTNLISQVSYSNYTPGVQGADTDPTNTTIEKLEYPEDFIKAAKEETKKNKGKVNQAEIVTHLSRILRLMPKEMDKAGRPLIKLKSDADVEVQATKIALGLMAKPFIDQAVSTMAVGAPLLGGAMHVFYPNTWADPYASEEVDNTEENRKKILEEYGQYGFTFGNTPGESIRNYFIARRNYYTAESETKISGRDGGMNVFNSRFSQKIYKTYTMMHGNGELLSFKYSSKEVSSDDGIYSQVGIDPQTGELKVKNFISTEKAIETMFDKDFMGPEESAREYEETKLFKEIVGRVIEGKRVSAEDMKRFFYDANVHPSYLTMPKGFPKDDPNKTNAQNADIKADWASQSIPIQKNANDQPALPRSQTVCVPLNALSKLDDETKAIMDSLRAGEESVRFKVEASIVGDPVIECGFTLRFLGLSDYDNGHYHLTASTHNITKAGYITELSLVGLRHITLASSTLDFSIPIKKIKDTLLEKMGLKGIKGMNVTVQYKTENGEVKTISGKSDTDSFMDLYNSWIVPTIDPKPIDKQARIEDLSKPEITSVTICEAGNDTKKPPEPKTYPVDTPDPVR